MDETLQAFKDNIIKIIRQQLKIGHYKIFFFGSRVSGKAGQRSDIDIGILSSDALLPGTILEIKEKLDELPTLFKFDVVDFSKVDNDFKEVALKSTEVIHEQ